MFKIGAMKLYVFLLFLLLSGKINIHAQQISEQPYVKVEGEVTRPLKLYQSDLDKMKRVTVIHKGHDSITNSYTGVPLIEILNRAGVTIDKELRGKNMTKYLLVSAETDTRLFSHWQS